MCLIALPSYISNMFWDTPQCYSLKTPYANTLHSIPDDEILSQCITWGGPVCCKRKSWICAPSYDSWRTCPADGPKTRSPPLPRPCHSLPGLARAGVSCEARTPPHRGQEQEMSRGEQVNVTSVSSLSDCQSNKHEVGTSPHTLYGLWSCMKSCAPSK